MEDPSPGSNRNLQRSVHQSLTCGSRIAHEKPTHNGSRERGKPQKALVEVLVSSRQHSKRTIAFALAIPTIPSS
jgi:hypothetical protein